MHPGSREPAQKSSKLQQPACARSAETRPGSTFESRRGEKMFERYGFKVMNRAEITKYKAYYPESVYLSTVIKNLETAEPLTVDVRSRL